MDAQNPPPPTQEPGSYPPEGGWQAPPPPPAPQVAWNPQPPHRPGSFDINDFLTFRYLITPGLITVIYVIAAVLVTLLALGAVVGGGSSGLVAGLLILVFGNLYVRVIAELFIVLFRMNDALQSIDRRGRGL